MGMRSADRTIGTVATLAIVLGSWLLVFPLHTPTPPVCWSYDLVQWILPSSRQPAPILIYMDEQAMHDYGQTPAQPWDRAIHARLLDRLSLDRPQVVVFDVTFTQAGDSKTDRAFAEAMRRNGKVVLAGDRVATTGQHGYTLIPPLKAFESQAAGWGIAKIHLDPDRVGRRYDAGDDQHASLAWTAAAVAGAPVTRNAEKRLGEERWLNYYGTGRPFDGFSMTYTNAETRPRGFFTGRAVFIGGKPETPLRGDITDVFGTPFTRWTGEFIPGAEITAIAFANLMNGDSLVRIPLVSELGILCLTGVISGWGLRRVRTRTALGLSIALMIIPTAACAALAVMPHLWFAWGIIVFVQIPCGWIGRLFSSRSSSDSESVATAAPSTPLPEPARHDTTVTIPDHTLLRCIGEGAYGQVWLARNTIGLFHAVKVIFKNRFGTEEPYQRAFRGIQKFMPVSRSEKGFVHILHVGRNDLGGYFFYIMEAGDDQDALQRIDPDSYQPKTLASELKRRGSLPVRECLPLMLSITEAVHQLHLHRLIHRDIKPANILFLNGHPKLADIDLVTDIASQGETSRIGTQGYMAPEGPGTPAADVFSLGRLLYVALTGKSPDQCPELPTRIGSDDDASCLMELNQIVCKACDEDLGRRYASAALMRADLLRVFNGLAD